MPVKWLLSVAVIGLLAMGSVTLVTKNQASTNVSSLQEGKALYLEHCASCHGTNLEGQPNWRKRKADGRLPAPPHDETGHTWHHPDTLLFKITKLGTEAIVGGDYKSNMPGFGDVLSDNQIRAVLEYIKRQWPENIRQRQERMNAPRE